MIEREAVGRSRSGGANVEPDVAEVMQRGWQALDPELDVEPIAVVQRVLRGARLILDRSDAHLATFGLTRGELDILSALRRAPEPLAPTELAELLLFSPAATTKRLNSLERRGLVSRQANPHDG